MLMKSKAGRSPRAEDSVIMIAVLSFEYGSLIVIYRPHAESDYGLTMILFFSTLHSNCKVLSSHQYIALKSIQAFLP